MHTDRAHTVEFVRPRLVVSRFLDLDACRYNGALIRTPLVRRLERFVDLITVCPEVEMGLGVPREPVRLIRRGSGITLVQPSTGRDLAAALWDFVSRFLAALPEVDGFLLKVRSPSCGIHGVKVFPGAAAEAPAGREAGMFARAVLARFPCHPIEHEGRLTNPRLLDHFLTRLFALADLRRAHGEGGATSLAALHSRYRLSLSPAPAVQREALDRIVRAREAGGVAEAWNAYAPTFRCALAHAAPASAHLSIIERIAHGLPSLLARDPASELAGLRQSYREGHAPRWMLLEALRRSSGGAGMGLDARVYLHPYPPELIDASPGG